MSTVLIIGAGASKDFHPEMGTGGNLIRGILSRVVETEARYLSIIVENQDKFNELAQGFHTKLSQWNGSIDAFLSEDDNKKYLILGKFMVAAHIMGYEGQSLHHYGKNDSWLYHLATKIEGKLGEADALENLRIITFNYDRLIENFLHCYFNRMGKWNSTLQEFVNKNIIHVYGSLGKLPFQNNKQFTIYALDNNTSENMESTMDHFELMYKNSEKMEEQKSKARCWIAKANQIYSLGFGYDCDNMKYLHIPSDKTIVSTALGLDEQMQKEIKEKHKLKYLDFKPAMTCAEIVKSEDFVL